MKRFDPGVAFARRFIDEEMGTRLALKAWYCDSSSKIDPAREFIAVDLKERQLKTAYFES